MGCPTYNSFRGSTGCHGGLQPGKVEVARDCDSCGDSDNYRCSYNIMAQANDVYYRVNIGGNHVFIRV